MSVSLKELIRIGVITAPSQSWPTYDGATLTRHEFVTASEATKCARELVFQKRVEYNTVPIPNYWDSLSDEEYENRIAAVKDNDKLGVFARGHNVEAWAVDMLNKVKNDNEAILIAGTDQVSFYHNELKVSGTPDGIFYSPRDFTLQEFKSTTSFIASPRSSHVAQVQINMGLINLIRIRMGDEAFANLMGWTEFLDENKKLPPMTEGKLLYIDPTNYLGMTEFKVEYDDGIELEKAHHKATQVFDFSKEERPLQNPIDVEAEGLDNRHLCTFCPFKQACAEIEQAKNNAKAAGHFKALRDSAGAAASKMFTFDINAPDELISTARKYTRLDAKLKEGKERLAGMKQALMDWVKVNGNIDKVMMDDELVTVKATESNVAGSIDTKSMAKELGINLEEWRKPPSTRWNFSCKVDPVEDIG